MTPTTSISSSSGTTTSYTISTPQSTSLRMEGRDLVLIDCSEDGSVATVSSVFSSSSSSSQSVSETRQKRKAADIDNEPRAKRASTALLDDKEFLKEKEHILALPNPLQEIIRSYICPIDAIVEILQQGGSIPEYLQEHARYAKHLDLSEIELRNSQTLQLLNCCRNIETLKMPKNPNIYGVCAQPENMDFTPENDDDCHNIITSIVALENLRHLDMSKWMSVSCWGSPIRLFTDDILQLLTSRGRFQYLDLTDCEMITDKGISYISECKDLYYLNLNISRSLITDNGLAYLTKLTNLNHFEIRNNQHITDTGISFLAELPSLSHLDISSCSRITDMGISAIGNFINLSYLNISGCREISDVGIGFLGALFNLRHLIISGCVRITDSALSTISSSYLNGLESLYLGYCTNIQDSGLLHLERMTKLQTLSLGGCAQFTDVALKPISNLPCLKSLDLSYCYNIHGEGLLLLEHMSQLQDLNLAGCRQFTSEALKPISALSELRRLDLSYCENIQDAGLQYLITCKELQHLDLKKCESITNEGISNLGVLIELEYLSFEGCKNVNNGSLRLLYPLQKLKVLKTYGTKVNFLGVYCINHKIPDLKVENNYTRT